MGSARVVLRTTRFLRRPGPSRRPVAPHLLADPRSVRARAHPPQTRAQTRGDHEGRRHGRVLGLALASSRMLGLFLDTRYNAGVVPPRYAWTRRLKSGTLEALAWHGATKTTSWPWPRRSS